MCHSISTAISISRTFPRRNSRTAWPIELRSKNGSKITSRGAFHTLGSFKSVNVEASYSLLRMIVEFNWKIKFKKFLVKFFGNFFVTKAYEMFLSNRSCSIL
jgi:hypothetical protein